MPWVKIGQGSYNTAYKDENSTLVFKVQLDKSNTDTPERSVRLWNEINNNLHL